MSLFEDKKRIIIKIGSSLLVEDGSIRQKWLKKLAKDIAALIKDNHEIIIVSSGSIALGLHSLETIKSKLFLREKQAAASIGQIELMSSYQKIFAKNNLKVAQILLNASDCNLRQRYLNCQNTIETLIGNLIVPIINENDSIVVDEIKVGDNDRLAARVAQMVDADLLILFSDIDGLYDSNPKHNKKAKLIKEVFEVNKRIENMAGGATSDVGTGGMITKIAAAKMLRNSSCDVIITSGVKAGALKKLFLKKQKFTIFHSRKTSENARKQWITGQLNLENGVVVNKCAVEALLNQKVSLLPVGIIDVIGSFEQGDVIAVFDEDKRQIASGISNYDFWEVQKILGKKTSEVKDILGKDAKKMVIHIDNLVVEGKVAT